MENNYNPQTIAEAASILQGHKAGTKHRLGDWVHRAFSKNKVTNPIQANQADIVPWYIYDRNTTAAAANTLARYTFYNVPIGQGAPKTKADTNMDQVMQLPAPQWFNLTHFGFYFTSNMVKADIDTFLNTYYFELWIGNKIYAEGPLQLFPSGAGLSGVDTRNLEGTFVNGQPYGQSVMFDCRLPAGLGLGYDGSGNPVVADGFIGHTILQSQQFKIEVYGTPFALAAATTPTLGAGLNLMSILYGILSRGVQ